jgi:hypothetical protein
MSQHPLLNTHPGEYMGQGTPFIYSVDYTGLTGVSNDAIIVGPTTYTYNTDFYTPDMMPPLGATGANFNIAAYVKGLAAAINADQALVTYHNKKVPNISCFARPVGTLLILVGRVPGLAFTVTPALNGSANAPTPTTEWTGVKQYS